MLKLVSRFLPFLIFFVWAIFSPLNASILFISFIVLIEGYYVLLEIFKNPDIQFIKEKYDLTSSELCVFKKYYTFYRFPSTSAKNSEIISTLQLFGFILIPWLLYNRLWIPAIIIIINFYLANYLSRKLKPLHFSHFAKPRELIYSEKKDIKSVYDKVVWDKGVNKEN